MVKRHASWLTAFEYRWWISNCWHLDDRTRRMQKNDHIRTSPVHVHQLLSGSTKWVERKVANGPKKTRYFPETQIASMHLETHHCIQDTRHFVACQFFPLFSCQSCIFPFLFHRLFPKLFNIKGNTLLFYSNLFWSERYYQSIHRVAMSLTFVESKWDLK